MNNNDDDDNIFEVRYLGGCLDNDYDDYENPRPHDVPDYIIPDDVNIRLMIDASVTKIDVRACYECTTLTAVVFHNKVITIGRQAFMYCSNLERIELPEGLLRLEDWAFDGCTSLQQIVIPASVQYLGISVFQNCSSLVRVVFVPTTNVVQLGSLLFWRCSDLRFVTLPQNLQSIPQGFFYNCTSLTHLQIPESVEEIGGGAFASSGIQAVNISFGDDFVPGTIILPPKLRSIPDSCFENCKSFTNIRIPVSVVQFGKQSFKGSAIQSIVMSNNVHTRIDQEAFKNCAFLERVTFHSTNLTMDNDVFANCPVLSVIMIAPWLWAKLFVSMNEHPEFIFKSFREYQTQIFDFQIVNPDVEVEGEGTLQNNIKDNNE